MNIQGMNDLQRIEVKLDNNCITQGIDAGEFYLAYQPQVDASSGALIGFEALMRWNSKTMGAISPDSFIKVAECGSAINNIWGHLLSTIACDRCILDHYQSPFLHLALNLSAVQLPQPRLAIEIEKWMDENSIDGSQIHIEITESALLSDGDQVIKNLMRLNEMGINLWLDDFGTGYSSLRHMRDLPITGLKIDKSFVSDLEENLDDFRIVSAIVAMSNSLGLKTIAEGVETESQAQILGQLGCNILQGYLIGRPDSMETLTSRWLPQHMNQV